MSSSLPGGVASGVAASGLVSAGGSGGRLGRQQQRPQVLEGGRDPVKGRPVPGGQRGRRGGQHRRQPPLKQSGQLLQPLPDPSRSAQAGHVVQRERLERELPRSPGQLGCLRGQLDCPGQLAGTGCHPGPVQLHPGVEEAVGLAAAGVGPVQPTRRRLLVAGQGSHTGQLGQAPTHEPIGILLIEQCHRLPQQRLGACDPALGLGDQAAETRPPPGPLG